MILTIRTDSPVAIVGLHTPKGDQLLEDSWEAGRRLHNELISHIELILGQHQQSWNDLTGVIVFQGPGSFTGLRLGVTAANTIAYAQQIPVVGTQGKSWIKAGLTRLESQENDVQVLPEYGAEPHITKPST
jgi:tRNA threonylcarbamoyladenosine biosynthesis protein TsaB